MGASSVVTSHLWFDVACRRTKNNFALKLIFLFPLDVAICHFMIAAWFFPVALVNTAPRKAPSDARSYCAYGTSSSSSRTRSWLTVVVDSR
jgi:hypothetical protein